MEVLSRTQAELLLLQEQLEWQAHNAEQLRALVAAIAELGGSVGGLPETPPLISHLQALEAALSSLPALEAEENRSTTLLEAALAAPAAASLQQGWRNLTTRFDEWLPLMSTEAELVAYESAHAAVPAAAGSLVDGALSLHGVLGSVAVLTAAGKSAVLAVEAQADSDLWTLEEAFLDGRNGSGYARCAPIGRRAGSKGKAEGFARQRAASADSRRSLDPPIYQ